MKVKLIRDTSSLPYYSTQGAAAFDLKADIEEPVDLWPGETRKVPTGLAIALPHGTAGLVLPRSGAALKGLSVANTPGLIDEDYRGEICVLAHNIGDLKLTIEAGDRIAQMLIVPYIRTVFDLADELDETDRGAGGFGSTGV